MFVLSKSWVITNINIGDTLYDDDDDDDDYDVDLRRKTGQGEGKGVPITASTANDGSTPSCVLLMMLFMKTIDIFQKE